MVSMVAPAPVVTTAPSFRLDTLTLLPFAQLTFQVKVQGALLQALPVPLSRIGFVAVTL